MADKTAATDETRVITYLAPGQVPDVLREDPRLDPELEKIRDREAEALAAVEIDTTLPEPTIDPELVKIRDEQIKRERERAATSDATTETTDSGTTTAKKSAAKKSDKK